MSQNKLMTQLLKNQNIVIPDSEYVNCAWEPVPENKYTQIVELQNRILVLEEHIYNLNYSIVIHVHK